MKKLKIILVILLSVIIATLLIACVPNSPDKTLDRLNDHEYKIVDNINEGAGLTEVQARYGKSLNHYIYAKKGNQSILVMYFDDSNDAKAALTTLKKEFAAFEERGDAVMEYQIKRDGKKVYAGTASAINIVKNVEYA